VDGASVVASTFKNIDLRRRAQKMRIVVQPALIVAQEVFASAIEVEVLDCSDSVAIYDSATVFASIEDNAGGGTISGMIYARISAYFGPETCMLDHMLRKCVLTCMYVLIKVEPRYSCKTDSRISRI